MNYFNKAKFHYLFVNKTGVSPKTINTTELSSGYIDEEISIEELVKAIITCGMPSYYLTTSITSLRKNEILYKVFAILSMISVEKEGEYIRLSEDVKYLDSSERAILSYYLGMVMTKYISQKKFSQDYLVHLSILEKNNTIIYNNINRKMRPDLIGWSKRNNQYSVFEAKGRYKKNLSTIQKALEQVQNINYIAGSKPSYAVAQMSHFKNGELFVVAVDPIGNGENGIKFDGDIEFDYKCYYEPIKVLFEDENTIVHNDNVWSVTYELDKITIDINIPDFLMESIKTDTYDFDNIKWESNMDFGEDFIKVTVTRKGEH